MPYYDQDFDPWVRGVRNMGSMILQIPQMRAQANAQLQRQNLHDAQMASETAQARKYNADAASTEEETAGGRRLGDALRRVTANPQDTNAVGDVFQEYGRYFKNHPQDAAQGLGTLLSQFQALQQGDPVQTFSASTGRPVGPNEIVGNSADERGNIVANRGQEVGDPMGTRLMSGQAVPTVLRPGTTAIAPEGTPAFKTVANGPAAPPKSAAVDATRARLIGNALMQDASDRTTNAPAILQRYDQMTAPPAATTNAPAQTNVVTQPITAVPPPEQRIVGRVYQTPKGMFAWTGQGWVPANR